MARSDGTIVVRRAWAYHVMDIKSLKIIMPPDVFGFGSTPSESAVSTETHYVGRIHQIGL